MTATLQLTNEAPFSLTNSAVGSAERMNALPVGSVVRQGQGDYEWTKGEDGRWSGQGDNCSAEDFDFNDRFQVHSIPALSAQDMRELPNDSIVFLNTSVGAMTGQWRKQSTDVWLGHNDLERTAGWFAGSTVYLIHTGEQDTSVESVLIESGALAVGMLVTPDNTTSPLIYVNGPVGEDSMFEAVTWVPTGIEDAVVGQRRANVYGHYTVQPQTALTRLAVKAAVAQRQADTGGTAIRAEWEQKMEALNERLHRFAESEGLDEDFDSMMDEHTDLGLTRRPIPDVTYVVTVELTGTFSRAVTVPHGATEEDIYQRAMDDAAFVEGENYQMHGETVTITNVTGDDYNEE